MSEVLERLATKYGIDLPAVLTVVEVESGPWPRLVGGLPVIRLEVHRLWRYWPATLRHLVDAVFHVDGPKPHEGHRARLGEGGSFIPLHVGTPTHSQIIERMALDLALNQASTIADEADRARARAACFAACSWGPYQILGSNYAKAGYVSAEELSIAFRDTEEQDEAFFRFLNAEDLIGNLRHHEWETFARVYNGNDNVDEYAPRLEAAYAKMTK